MTSNNEMMNKETYEAALALLTHANPEDYINLVQASLMRRENNEWTREDETGAGAQFVLPAQGHNEAERLVTIGIRVSDIG
jgi:hypothetical protein